MRSADIDSYHYLVQVVIKIRKNNLIVNRRERYNFKLNEDQKILNDYKKILND